MSSKSETGHAINIGKFANITERVEALGALYNPGMDQLKLTALQSTVVAGNDSLSAVHDAGTLFTEKTNVRKQKFALMQLLVSNVIGMLIVFESSEATIDDARGIAQKIRGERAGKKKSAPPPTDTPVDPTDDGTGDIEDVSLDSKTISVSQRSYVNRADHFSKFVALVKTQAAYAPNEPEFSVAGLETLRDELKAENEGLDKAASDLFTSRNLRDQIIYKPKTGMYSMSLAIKKYVRGITSHDDPRFKAISRIKLTNPERKKK